MAWFGINVKSFIRNLILSLKKKIILVAVVAIAVITLGVTAVAFVPVSFRDLSQVEFRIERGDEISEIAQNLSESGLIRSELTFKILAVVLGKDKSLQAGLYKLDKTMSAYKIVNIFSNGRSESEDVIVTIPEGSNINDLDLIFTKSGLTQKGDLLKKDYVDREGYLFPDTYRFSPGTSLPDIVSRLSENFNTKTVEVYRSRDLAVGDTIKAVLVASILEKEVQTAEDMAIVAGIIEKRLSLGMRLEIDATTAYGECRPKWLLGQNCETSDVNLIEGIKKTTPYNTYRIAGLPTGPISNPGIKALNAALHPVATDYLYYLTDKEGKVYYARTGAEHAKNRAKYLNR